MTEASEPASTASIPFAPWLCCAQAPGTIAEPGQLEGEFTRRAAFALLACVALHNKEIGDDLWKDAPRRELGPHDGMSDLRRVALKARRRKK